MTVMSGRSNKSEPEVKKCSQSARTRAKRKRRRKELDQVRRNVLATRNNKLKEKYSFGKRLSSIEPSRKALNKFLQVRQNNDVQTQTLKKTTEEQANKKTVCPRLLPEPKIGMFRNGISSRIMKKVSKSHADDQEEPSEVVKPIEAEVQLMKSRQKAIDERDEVDLIQKMNTLGKGCNCSDDKCFDCKVLQLTATDSRTTPVRKNASNGLPDSHLSPADRGLKTAPIPEVHSVRRWRWSPVNCFEEFCAKICAEHFVNRPITDSPDPVNSIKDVLRDLYRTSAQRDYNFDDLYANSEESSPDTASSTQSKPQYVPKSSLSPKTPQRTARPENPQRTAKPENPPTDFDKISFWTAEFLSDSGGKPAVIDDTANFFKKPSLLKVPTEGRKIASERSDSPEPVKTFMKISPKDMFVPPINPKTDAINKRSPSLSPKVPPKVLPRALKTALSPLPPKSNRYHITPKREVPKTPSFISRMLHNPKPPNPPKVSSRPNHKVKRLGSTVRQKEMHHRRSEIRGILKNASGSSTQLLNPRNFPDNDPRSFQDPQFYVNVPREHFKNSYRTDQFIGRQEPKPQFGLSKSVKANLLWESTKSSDFGSGYASYSDRSGRREFRGHEVRDARRFQPELIGNAAFCYSRDVRQPAKYLAVGNYGDAGGPRRVGLPTYEREFGEFRRELGHVGPYYGRAGGVSFRGGDGGQYQQEFSAVRADRSGGYINHTGRADEEVRLHNVGRILSPELFHKQSSGYQAHGDRGYQVRQNHRYWYGRGDVEDNKGYYFK